MVETGCFSFQKFYEKKYESITKYSVVDANYFYNLVISTYNYKYQKQ